MLNFDAASIIPEVKEGLKTIFRNIPCRDAIPPLVVTNPESVELEYIMNGICDELEQAGCIAFTGDRRWLNFRLEYSEGKDFPSFSLMLKCMHRHAGYRNDFSGVVRIDLTEWTEHVDEPKLSALLAFVHDFSDCIFFILSVTCNEPHVADALKKETNKWMFTVTTDATSPTVEALTKIVEEKLDATGHHLTDDARQLLADSISTLSAQKHFAGIRQIESLSAAILAEIGDIEEVSANHLDAFSCDSEWVKSCIDDAEITMGFTGGGF